MGGQEKYRKIYVQNPDIYFSETDYLYFIIDIQDELRFTAATDYLRELLGIFRELGYKNDIIIVFHKYDPKYAESKDFEDRAEMLKNLIQTQNKDLSFTFFQTSIYDIASLSRAMSYSLSNLLQLDEIDEILTTLIQKYDSNYAILYTNSGLIISDSYTETMDAREFDEIISGKISEDLKFFQRLSDEQVSIDGRLTYVDNNMEYVKRYQVRLGDKRYLFYLGISAPPNALKSIKADLEGFQAVLESTFS